MICLTIHGGRATINIIAVINSISISITIYISISTSVSSSSIGNIYMTAHRPLLAQPEATHIYRIHIAIIATITVIIAIDCVVGRARVASKAANIEGVVHDNTLLSLPFPLYKIAFFYLQEYYYNS